MKKIALFFLILLIAIACTPKEEGETTPSIDRTKLSRLIYYPGKSNEIHWHFNSKGLLEKKTKPDGTLIQSFEYSAQNNLISRTDYVNGVATTTDRYTYDTQNHITSFSGIPVTFDALTSTYTLDFEDPIVDDEYEFVDKYEFKVTEEGLLSSAKSYVRSSDGNWVVPSPLFGSIWDSNLTGYSDNDVSSYSCLYDNKVNPIKQSVLAICRVSLFYLDIYSADYALGQLPKLCLLPECYSMNNVMQIKHVIYEYEEGWIDKPALYEYKFNDLNLPVSKTETSYGTSETEILYYYQGDIIP